MTITVHFVTAPVGGSFEQYDVAAKPGMSLMQAAVNANLEGIAADCGGAMTCATCHVHVDEPWRARVPPAKAGELDMLQFTAEPADDGSRLSCQIVLTQELDGLTVRLPARQY
ncbi:MAG: 2Fe-2S iron-sulfur cluster binding domain-containing protein [Burkholderiales bacterium]|nr:2Fe-2S iron-sulfur cluster binding domain-containing protein [Burkholderiales bacterium]MBK8666815.1 2Fe-2S iron-sulfur cluster binding domain-containing protein [Burkholderiales bacterium]